MSAQHAISDALAGVAVGGGDGAHPSLPPLPDMTEEGYAISLAYAGDASWPSILLLRTDIMCSIFERALRQC
jgi:hypothetical protein